MKTVAAHIHGLVEGIVEQETRAPVFGQRRHAQG